MKTIRLILFQIYLYNSSVCIIDMENNMHFLVFFFILFLVHHGNLTPNKYR